MYVYIYIYICMYTCMYIHVCMPESEIFSAAMQRLKSFFLVGGGRLLAQDKGGPSKGGFLNNL